MYRCLECGCVFNEPEKWQEDRGECFGFPSYEIIYGCRCGSVNVIELRESDSDICD